MTEKWWLPFALGALTVVVGGALAIQAAAASGGMALTNDGIVFPDGSVQTTAVASEVQNFFLATAEVTMDPGVGGLGKDLIRVPPGFRALVEQASVDCVTPPTDPVMSVKLWVIKVTGPSTYIEVPFEIPIGYQSASLGGEVYLRYIGGLSTRLYSDSYASGPIRTSISRAHAEGTGTCRVSINGRFLPVPSGEL